MLLALSIAGVTLTGDISLGNLAIIVTLIGIAIRVGVRFGSVQTTLTNQAILIESHAQRLDKYEQRLTDIVGQVQRIVGRIEATQERLERTTGHRKGEGGHVAGA